MIIQLSCGSIIQMNTQIPILSAVYTMPVAEMQGVNVEFLSCG
jgi:hypothetical protein